VKVLFFGSSEFSLPSLTALAGSPHSVIACVTTPARPQGRGLKVVSNPVERFANEKGIPCLAPETLKDPVALEEVKKRGPVDIFVVASYGKMIPEAWLKIPAKLPLNVHPSLLPKYRGAAPINWQILNGESQAGVTLFVVEKGLDCGDILAQKAWPLGEDETAVTLEKTSAEEGARLLMETLEAVERGPVRAVPQDLALASYAPKLKKEDGLIDWTKPAREIDRRVRGLLPWPAAFTFFRGESLKIVAAVPDRIACAEAGPGNIIEISKSQGTLRVQTGEGTLTVARLQPAGKREMSAHEFAIGQRLVPGMTLG
jgi:methionyl-tRNA formyltransferase